LLGVGEQEAFGWPEGLLYVNGTLRQGINRHHSDVLLLVDDIRRTPLEFDVRAWSGMLEGDHRVELAELALLDRPSERLYFLLHAGTDLVETLAEDDPILYAVEAALEEAYDQVDLRRPYADAFYASTREALALLSQRLERIAARHAAEARPLVT